MKPALLHATQRRELGKDDSGGPDAVHELQTDGGGGCADDPPQLGEHPLGRDPRQRRRGDACQLKRPRLWVKPQLARQTREAQRPQGVVLERIRRDGPKTPLAQVLKTAERVHVAVAAQRGGDGVDRQVPPFQILLNGGAVERQHVHLPAVVVGHHPPSPERLGQLERVAARRPPQITGRVGNRTGEGHVEVGGGAPQHAVAHRAPHQPAVGGEPGKLRHRVRHGTGTPSRWYWRGTRAEIPHRTSWLMVDRRLAMSSTVWRSSPDRPMSIAAAPTFTSGGSGPTSAVTLSMLTVPTSG